MKKSSIFLIIVTFILSIFMISFYGLSVRTDHFTTYINHVEITQCKVINNNSVLTPEVLGSSKSVFFNFNIGDGGSVGLFIEYEVNPTDVEEEQYGFELVGEDKTFVNDEGIEYHYAEISKNKLTINAPCGIKVALRTYDGSGQEDFLNIIAL